MTTNVYDVRAALLTSDSRWSAEDGDWVAFVDNTNYDKIVHDNKLAFLFAGPLPEIDIWKQWILAGRKKEDLPSLANTTMSVIQVDVAKGVVVFKSHQFLNSSFGIVPRALFAGTGAKPAKDCWDRKKCAMTAIGSAAEMDHLTGGNVVFFNRAKRSGNITNTSSATELKEQAKQRGMIMSKSNAEASVLIKVAANDPSNPTKQALAMKVMSGAAPFAAPFPGMEEPWSLAKKLEFEAALALYD